jgi:hypothetical protein
MAPALANSVRVVDHPDYMVRVILRGLVGAIEGKTYTGAFMAPMHDENDAWIASVVSFIRTNLGNDGSMVSEEEVAAIRKVSEGDKPYSYESLNAQAIKQLVPNKDWNVTASHTGLARVGGTKSAFAAFGYEGWTSGDNQTEDMWFQIELPYTVNFSELQFISPPVRRGSRADALPPLQTYPTAYMIEVSHDGKTWSPPVAQGRCDNRKSKIVFPLVAGRFIKITQTGKPPYEAPWKMESMKVFGSLNKESI